MPVFGSMPTLPFKVGDMPREPGWYVLDGPQGREICEAVLHKKQLVLVFRGNDELYPVAPIAEQVRFIARIYPEKIKG